MVTRSIVGRFLIVAILLVSLGVIAEAALKITAESGKRVAKIAPPAPSEPLADAAPAAPKAALVADAPEAAPVRVVYPGPLGDAPAPARKIADAAPASPLAPAAQPPAQATAPAQQPAAVAPQAAAPAVVQPAAAPIDAQVASADPAAGTPAAAPAPAKGGLDLNTASVDALNRLGGGHIGQSIVKHRPYRSVEELVKKRVVRRSVYDQIKDQLAAN